METTTTLLLLAATALFLYFKFFYNAGQQKQKQPPGPAGIPVFGNLLQIGRDIHLSFYKWAREYGDIFSVQLGGVRAIVVNNPVLIRQMYSDVSFCGRPQTASFQKLSLDGHGIGVAQGQPWEDQRRFTLRHLRDLGFSKSKYLESLVVPDVHEILDILKSGAGRPVSLSRTFSLAVLNSLLMVISGKRYKIDDPHLNELLENSMGALLAVFDAGILMFFPWIRFILPGLSGWTKLVTATDALGSYVDGIVREHHSSSKSGGDGLDDDEGDFIDQYLYTINNTTDATSSFYDKVGHKFLRGVVGDLLQAGSDTTSKALNWAVLFAAAFPEIQSQIQKEIDEVVGLDRLPSLSDRPKMVYTEAFIQELLRKSSITPIGVIHVALMDKEFNGYFIRKGTFIFHNAYHMHHDPKLWKDPHLFNPDRFLSPDRTKLVTNDALMPFSTGKRICIGENVSRAQIFLFTTGILQKFKIQSSTGRPEDLDLDGSFSYIMAPKPFEIVAKARY